MFWFASVIVSAILVSAFVDFIGIARSMGIKLHRSGLVVITIFIVILGVVLVSPVMALDTDNDEDSDTEVVVEEVLDSIETSVHTFQMKIGQFGDMSISVDTLEGNALKISVFGETITVDLDTSLIPHDSLIAIIDSAQAITKVKTITMPIAVSLDDDTDNRSTHPFPTFMGSMIDPVASIFVVAIVFGSLLLLCLGLPLIILVLLLIRWRYVHKERMRAIEEGVLLPTNGKKKEPADYFRKGLVLLFVGLGFLITIPWLEGFGAVLAAILVFWGLGTLIWYHSQRKKHGSNPDIEGNAIRSEKD